MRSISLLLAAVAVLATSSVSRAQCPPNTPAGLTASDGTNCAGVSLDWNEVSGESWYEVWRNDTNDWNTAFLIATPNGSSYFDATALPGVTHHYWVTSWRVGCLPGHNRSGHNNRTTGYRGGAPSAPTNVTGWFDGSPCRLHVTWNGDPRALFYTVAGLNAVSGAWDALGQTTGTEADFGPFEVPVTQVRVKAIGACGQTDSAEEEVAMYLGELRNMAASDGTDCLVHVTWDPPIGPPNVHTYRVYRDGNLIATLGGASVQYADADADPGQHNYMVRADSGCDERSAQDVGSRSTSAVPITAQPRDVDACEGTPAPMSVAASGTGLQYEWQIEAPGGSWITLQATPSTLPCGGSAFASPPNAASTTISVTRCPGVNAYNMRARVYNSCSVGFSTPATIGISSPDFNGDGDIGTDADIEAFFACLGGNCCATCGSVDFNGDGDVGTDADIEAFFRVLAGGSC